MCDQAGVTSVRMDCCEYHAHYLKPTRIAGNLLSEG